MKYKLEHISYDEEKDEVYIPENAIIIDIARNIHDTVWIRYLIPKDDE